MPRLSYAIIRSLIAREEIRGDRVFVTFRCAASQMDVESSAPIADAGAAPQYTAPSTSMLGGLRRSLSSLVRTVVGGDGAQSDPAIMARLTGAAPDAARHAAIISAFKEVQGRFAWAARRGQFVSLSLVPQLQSELARLVQATPLHDDGDRRVLARMLAEIAAADGTISDEEKGFFDAFAGTAAGNITELLAAPRLDDADLQTTSPPVRENLLMLAGALAYCDEDFDPTERTRLDHFGSGLGIAAARARELQTYAAEYVVDQLFESAYVDGVMDEPAAAQVYGVATKIGIAADRAAQLDGRCRTRRGIE